MKITMPCKKCNYLNSVGFKNFKQEDRASIEGKSFAFKCKGCGEVLKFKLEINGQNKG
jgi:RNase P subunit RPR2